MNGLTQSTTTKILALEKITELDVLQIIDAALATAEKPLRDEVESGRKLINETNERCSSEVNAARETMSAQQNEIIGLRAELAEAREKVIRAANTIGQQTAEIEQFKAAADTGNPS